MMRLVGICPSCYYRPIRVTDKQANKGKKASENDRQTLMNEWMNEYIWCSLVARLSSTHRLSWRGLFIDLWLDNSSSQRDLDCCSEAISFSISPFQTSIGNVLVSVNPYKKLLIYSPEVIDVYRCHCLHQLPPHMWVNWIVDETVQYQRYCSSRTYNSYKFSLTVSTYKPFLFTYVLLFIAFLLCQPIKLFPLFLCSYAVTDRAWRSLREMNCDQCILVSSRDCSIMCFPKKPTW